MATDHDDAASTADLPCVFTPAARWHAGELDTLAVFCSDGRWDCAFDEFCREHLRAGHGDRFAVPGGPGWLAGGEGRHGALYAAARGQIEFLVTAHKLRRVALIAHYGCGFYQHRLDRDADGCLSTQLADLRRVAAEMRQWFGGNVLVEAYMGMRRGEAVTFHRVD